MQTVTAFPFRELSPQAEFVFKGKVVQRAAATLKAMPVDAATSVVIVEQVYRAPPMFRFLDGKSLTIVTKDAALPPVGKVTLFLARGWLYGESIALVEIAHTSDIADYSALPRQLMEQNELDASEALRERIKPADVVVAGRVIATRQIEDLDSGSAGEHAAVWSEASIRVTAWEKGAEPADEISIVYAASRDIKWHRSPKLTVGQEGVWILRKQFIPELKREVLTALHRLDSHPIAALARVRTLI